MLLLRVVSAQWSFVNCIALTERVDSSKAEIFGKISAQPHTIVKQIYFPNGNVFVIVFSIQELNA